MAWGGVYDTRCFRVSLAVSYASLSLLLLPPFQATNPGILEGEWVVFCPVADPRQGEATYLHNTRKGVGRWSPSLKLSAC
ncbi:hypothetical protein F4809DRAFT_158415 [Biscogniauxia mediterranea]|nr:hypothetical protein F4809DRAFT_158415 [Biscogniauxia mediterranea]